MHGESVMTGMVRAEKGLQAELLTWIAGRITLRPCSITRVDSPLSLKPVDVLNLFAHCSCWLAVRQQPQVTGLISADRVVMVMSLTLIPNRSACRCTGARRTM